MLHRVSEKKAEGLPCNENMKVSPDYLERFIVEAKSKGYSFIPLSDLMLTLSKGEISRKSIIITLDDGYKDNLINGFPIFKKHNIPFIIYLSTYFIENNTPPWWYILEELLLSRDEILYMEEWHKIDSMFLKEKMFLSIRQVILDDNVRSDSRLVGVICRDNNFKMDEAAKEDLFLDWSEVGSLSGCEGVEFGNHGHGHVNLTKCGEESIRDEFTYASGLIYKHIGKKPVHYSYPYGLYDKRVLRALEACGAYTAVTTDNGVFDNKNSLMQIPRFMLCEGMSVDDLQVEALCSLLRKVL
jgi:peptidoglycan/xylan/chitin deacetylase (PgdA/CDA1 family)